MIWETILEVERHIYWLTANKARMVWEAAAEEELTRKLQRLFKNAEKDIIRKLVAAGRVPAGPVAARQLLRELEKIQGPLRETVLETALQAGQQGHNSVINELRKAGSAIAFREMSGTVAQRIADHVFIATDRTLERVIGDVMANLTESYNQGKGIKEAAESLRQTFENMQRYELRRVARTEVNSFQNQGTYETQKQLGVKYHQWWSAGDNKVRNEPDADHVYMHGQIVRVGEPFSNGLYHPGDRAGGYSTIKEWINCRCRHPVFIMPLNKMPPPGQAYFYEHEIVEAAPAG